GVIVLLVPRKDHRPGTGSFFIATGKGAEGFLTDAAAGRIRDAVAPELAREDYSGGLVHAVGLVAAAFGREFGVTVSGETLRAQQPARERRSRGGRVRAALRRVIL